MKILIACEFSGMVRNAFRVLGHDAWSCDLLPATDKSPFHYQCDVRDIWNMDFDLWGFHPPCTYLCSSGLHWNDRGRGWAKTNEALAFVRFLMTKDKPWYLENPIGCISSRIRKYDQIIQPWMFGDPYSKQTCLWLNKLPKLVIDPARFAKKLTLVHNGRTIERWANQTYSCQNNIGPSEDRWAKRSITYPGIANAMAIQWSK